MVSEDVLIEIHEQIVTKSVYEIQVSTLDYYYKLIYSKGINNKCSQCLIDAHVQIKRFYRAKVGLMQKDKLTSNDCQYLRLAMLRMKDKPEHIEWIKNKIKELQ
jgi:hypothetical protein